MSEGKQSYILLRVKRGRYMFEGEVVTSWGNHTNTTDIAIRAAQEAKQNPDYVFVVLQAIETYHYSTEPPPPPPPIPQKVVQKEPGFYFESRR